MKTRPEIFRDKAMECEHLAARARDPVVKQELTTIARVWRQMADLREKDPALIAQLREKARSAPLCNRSFALTHFGMGPATSPSQFRRMVNKSGE